MQKIKFILLSFAIIPLFLATNLQAATTTFAGEVTLPTTITDLLDTCSGSECPSIEIYVRDTNYEDFGYGSVDYNGSAYVYQLNVRDASSDISYTIQIDIENGDMGNESFFYDFGPDNQISEDDALRHEDDLRVSSFPIEELLYVASAGESFIVNLDFTDKNVGGQQIKGKIKLPSDVDMLETTSDDYGYKTYRNKITVYMREGGGYLSDINIFTYLNRIVDADGNYGFSTSIPEGIKVSTHIYGTIYDADISSYYQAYTDPLDTDDHTIDGDEKLVSKYLSAKDHYVEFTETVADFGVIDMDAYLDGYFVVLHGKVMLPDDILDKDTGATMFMSIYDTYGKFYSNVSIYYSEEESSLVYRILIPDGEENAITQYGLNFQIDFSWNEEYEYKNFTTYYSFGADNHVGGINENLDHLLEGCIDQYNALPLMIEPTEQIVQVDINASNYILPNTSNAHGSASIPSQFTSLYVWVTDMTCYNTDNGNGWTTDNYDGTWSYQLNGLVEGHDYIVHVDYSDSSYTNRYNYVLNQKDGILTNPGVYLDEVTYDDNWEFIYPSPLAIITGTSGGDIQITPFEVISPSNKGLSPSIVMYLLN